MGHGPLTLTEIDGDQDGTADDGQGQEDIPAHVGEAQKDGGIHSDPVGHVLFLGMQNRMEPGEKALADGRRRVFLIGMLELGSIDNVVARTEEGEKEGRRKVIPMEVPKEAQMAVIWNYHRQKRNLLADTATGTLAIMMGDGEQFNAGLCSIMRENLPVT